jgi:hypothetical protein
MTARATLLILVWTFSALLSAGWGREMARHNWSILERDPYEAREHERVMLVFGVIGGPVAVLGLGMFSGFGAYGWENPLGACYWQQRPFGQECTS